MADGAATMRRMPGDTAGGPAGAVRGQAGQAAGAAVRSWARFLEPWFVPFALVNAAAVGLTPILLPVVAVRYGVGHVGLVMGAFNLGAFAAPLMGSMADRHRAYRLLTTVCAALAAVSLWLFPLAGPAVQLLLALADGAGFAGAVTIANLLIVERRPEPEWNSRLSWLETALSVGQAGGLILAAWLSGLSARTGLLLGALVPAAAVLLALLLVPRMPPRAAPGTPAAQTAARAAQADARAARNSHQLRSEGHVGEWGPASPSRAHHLHHRRRPWVGLSGLLRGGFGWMLAAWIPAYGGTAILFALYPLLFQHSFGIAPNTSAIAFAVIVFLSLPLFMLAGRTCQRRGPARAIAGAMAVRVILLAALAVLAAAGHVPAALPLIAFAGVMFAWSFLSVASPALTGQLKPNAEGDAQGLLAAGSGIAGLVGSVAGGLVASQWGYSAALSAGAAAVAVGLVIFLATVARRRRVA
jgi:MFS family permease